MGRLFIKPATVPEQIRAGAYGIPREEAAKANRMGFKEYKEMLNRRKWGEFVKETLRLKRIGNKGGG